MALDFHIKNNAICRSILKTISKLRDQISLRWSLTRVHSEFVGHSTEIIRQSKIKVPLQKVSITYAGNLPFLKGELCLLRLLLFFAQSKDVAEEDFFLAGLFRSASRCSFKSCSLFCFCKAIRCCCKERLGMSPAMPSKHTCRNDFFDGGGGGTVTA